MDSGADHEYFVNFFQGQQNLGVSSKSTNPLLWFSFDVGYIHIVVVNTEVYCEAPTLVPDQLTWLDADLSNTKKNSPKSWIIALGHRQLYDGEYGFMHADLMKYGMSCTDATKYSTCNIMKPCTSDSSDCGFSLEKVLSKYSVDLMLVGHVHDYTRHFPILRNKTYEVQTPGIYLNPQGTVHVISGAAGIQNSPTGLTGYHLEHIEDDHVTEDPISPAVAVHSSNYTYSLITVHNATHLEFNQVDAAANGNVDIFWIIKDSEFPPWNMTKPFTINASTQTVCDQ